MANKNNAKKLLKKIIWTKFSFGLILFTIVCIVTFVIINVISLNLKHAEKKAKVNAAMNVGSSLVRYNFARIFADLTYLSSTDAVIDYVQNPSKDNREHLENEFKNFQNSSQIYDQIRFIDAHGMEKIRTNYFKEGSMIVPLDKLQSKKASHYFIAAGSIKDDKIFVSPLDLNKEHGK